MSTIIGKENPVSTSSRLKNANSVKSSGFTVLSTNAAPGKKDQLKSFHSNVPRQALGNVSNVLSIQKTNREPAKEEFIKKDCKQPEEKTAVLKGLVLEAAEEDWPEIEYQPKGDPDTDDEDAWLTMSLEHISCDDVTKHSEWQPNVEDLHCPISLSPPDIVSPSFHDLSQKISLDFEFDVLAFIPFD